MIASKVELQRKAVRPELMLVKHIIVKVHFVVGCAHIVKFVYHPETVKLIQTIEYFFDFR